MMTTALAPVDLVTGAFEQRGNPVTKHEGEYKKDKIVYYRTNCPTSNHRNGDACPSLDYWEVINDEGRATVYFHCFSGSCTRQEILLALGTQGSLVPGAPTTNYAKRPIITLFDIETHTKLPWQLLFNLGWHDGQATFHRPNGSSYKERGVIIPYYLEDGTEFERSKIRLGLDKSDEKKHPRWKWTEGDKIILYGLPNLKRAREVGYCVINEGESDTATLQICKIPAVGVPGTNSVLRTIHANSFAGVPRIYVIQEKTDEAGKNFPYDVKRQLLSTGYTGEILRVPLRDLTGAKDPNALWQQLYQVEAQPELGPFIEAFRAAFQKTLDQAKPMDVDTGREGQPSTDIDTSAIDQAIQEQDVIALLNASSTFAQLSELDFTIYKQEIQEVFGKDVVKDLNRVVGESRKVKKQQEEKIARTQESVPPNSGSQGLCRFTPDDAGNGDALYELYGEKFLYCGAIGWLFYNGTYWELDAEMAEVRKCAVITLRERRLEAVIKGNESIVRCTIGDEKRVSGCVNRFKNLVTVKIDVFDNDPDLLNCKNGVVDFRTGTLSQHDHTQRFTYCVPVDYEVSDFSEWIKYLSGVVGGGQEIIDYLQMALGYSFTGWTSEEVLFYLWGPTRSGKGTVAEVVMRLLPNPLSTMVDFNSFTAKREGDVSNFDLAELKPSRLIFASESQRNQSLNPAKIKQLTGGDLIRACFKHRNFFAYRPQFKVWMLSNWPVNGDPEDDALWGRVRVIPFPNSFLGKEDKTKKARLKSPDVLKGVLYWIVQGAIKWYALGASGLHTPQLVATTTKKQRDELDFVQQWLEECCSLKDGVWTSSEDIMNSYTAWCEANSVSAKKARGLAQSLQTKGFRTGIQKKQRDGRNIKGVEGLVITPLKAQMLWTDSNDLVAGSGSSGSNSIKSPLYKEEGNIEESSATSATRYQSVTDQSKDGTTSLAEPSQQGSVISPALSQEFNTSRVKVEHRIEYNRRYVQRKDVLQSFLWNAPKSGYENELLDFESYLARIDELGASGDPMLISAAIEAMQRTLGEYSEKRGSA
jgi:putative DNA primase/helicase